MQLFALGSLATVLASLAPSQEVPSAPLWADFDGDGRPDVYLHGGGRPDVLLINDGEGGFVDRTREAGLAGLSSRLVVLADLDRDGRADLVRLAAGGVPRLHAGLGEGRFDAVGRPVGGAAAPGLATLAARDLDLDGDLDLSGTTAAGELVTFENVGALAFEPSRRFAAAATAAGLPPVTIAGADATSPGTSVPGTAGAAGPRGPVGSGNATRGSSGAPSSAGPTTASPRASVATKADALVDQGVSGGELRASSVPTLGMLYPLSSDFFVDAAGNVGIGTTTLASDVKLEVVGKTVFGTGNTATGGSAAVGGGDQNQASGSFATVAGGTNNRATATYTTVAGGVSNIAAGLYAAVPGGNSNRALGQGTLAAGQHAEALHDGTFVWADTDGGAPGTFSSTGPDQFLVRAVGGAGFGTAAPLASMHVTDQGIGLGASAIRLDTIVGEDPNAILGLYSDSGGSLGSGIVLGEVVGGALTDKWSIVRTTAGLPPGLLFSYGSNPAYNLNKVYFSFTDAGELRIGPSFGAYAPSDLRIGRQAINQDVLDFSITANNQLALTSSSADVQVSAATSFAVNGSNLFVDGATGNVGIATATPAFTLHVNGSAGKPGGGSWSTASDRRLKKDVRGLQDSLERLLALRGVTYEYKHPEAIGELPGRRTGMIAQEVREVFPDWVETASDGYLRLTFRGFEALTVEALRDLRAEKDAQIAALEARLERLERLLATTASADGR